MIHLLIDALFNLALDGGIVFFLELAYDFWHINKQKKPMQTPNIDPIIYLLLWRYNETITENVLILSKVVYLSFSYMYYYCVSQ